MILFEEKFRAIDPQCERLWHAPAYHAQRRASYLGESGWRVAKSVAWLTDRTPVLSVLPACCQVDVASLRRLLDVADLRLAGDAELSGLFPDCEYGVVPGFGRSYQFVVALDQRLLDQPYLIVPGTSSFADYRIDPRVYRERERPICGNFTLPLAFADSSIVAPSLTQYS